MDDEYILLQKKQDDIVVDIGLLDEEELHRYNRYIDSNKKAEFLAGRCFLKQELSKMVQMPPHDIRISLSANGKPYHTGSRLASPHFNLSHSNGVLVIAFSKFPIGVDIAFQSDVSIESLQPFLSDKELSVLNDQTETEQKESLIHLFTMKEAFIKATDKVWGLDLISFNWNQDGWQLWQPVENCSFKIHKTKEHFISICLLKNE